MVWQLALAALCFYIATLYMQAKTLFSVPFVNLGLVPEAGSSYILPRLLGFARASEIILLGEKFSVEQAKIMVW